MITVRDLTVGYDDRAVLTGVDVQFGAGRITTVLGPNGCGKSTLLGAICGRLRARAGEVRLGGTPVAALSRRSLARRLAFVHQRHVAPTDITVAELVAHGRAPHRPWYRRGSTADREIVEWALDVTRLDGHAHRAVASLSGGEAQRAWIALALAQRPEVLLLDEPTTYLDIAHQLEVLELITRIKAEEGLTVGMVVHDVNHASAFSDEIIVLSGGAVRASGAPEHVLTEDLIAEVYDVEARIDRSDPLRPRIHPLRRLAAYDPWSSSATPTPSEGAP